MASYHCSVSVGPKGKAAAHAEYVAREGKYSGSARYEDLEASGSGCMPKWAEHNPAHFWAAADQYERANGAAYREIEVALPRELTPAQRLELVEDFIRRELGDRHAYTFGIHCPAAAIEGGEQPHGHIMYSERTIDGIDRDPHEYFRRWNAKAPERGGCRKDSAGTEERLLATRELWATVQNEHLARHGHAARVDHRSLEAQGIDRQPERHLGPKGLRDLSPQDVAALLEKRAAEGEHERAQRDLTSTVIDVSGDLSAAVADRGRRQAEAERARQEDRERQRQAAEQERRRQEELARERRAAERAQAQAEQARLLAIAQAEREHRRQEALQRPQKAAQVLADLRAAQQRLAEAQRVQARADATKLDAQARARRHPDPASAREAEAKAVADAEQAKAMYMERYNAYQARGWAARLAAQVHDPAGDWLEAAHPIVQQAERDASAAQQRTSDAENAHGRARAAVRGATAARTEVQAAQQALRAAERAAEPYRPEIEAIERQEAAERQRQAAELERQEAAERSRERDRGWEM